MKNKKLDELKKSVVSTEKIKQQSFVDELAEKIKKDKEDLEKWIDEFKVSTQNI